MAKRPKPVHQMTEREFETRFPIGDEDACSAYLKARRWPEGVRCPRCGNPAVYDLHSRKWHWQCTQCAPGGNMGYRFSVIAGTIFENTNKPLRDWFKVVHLMTTSKKGISALQIQRQLGFGSYKTAHGMCHKIRAAMMQPQEKLGGIILRPRGGTLARYRQAGLLLLENSDDGFLIAIRELRGVEVRRLALEDVLGQLEHIRLDLHIRNVVEIFFRVPKLVGIAQCGSHQPLVPGLEHDHPFAFRQHDTTERHRAFATHGLADHGKGFLASLVVRHDVIGVVQVSLVDLLARNERVDVDGVVALDRNGIEFIIVHRNVGVLGILVAAALFVGLDWLTRDLVDQLLAQSVAGLL